MWLQLVWHVSCVPCKIFGRSFSLVKFINLNIPIYVYSIVSSQFSNSRLLNVICTKIGISVCFPGVERGTGSLVMGFWHTMPISSTPSDTLYLLLIIEIKLLFHCSPAMMVPILGF